MKSSTSGYAAPDKNDFFPAIVSDDRRIVFHVWIGIEKFMSPVPDEESRQQKDDDRDRESDAQCWKPLLNHGRHQQIVEVHGRTVSTRFAGCYDAFVGFSRATEGGIVTLSSEIDAALSR